MTTKQYWLICVLAGVCVLLAAEKYRLNRALTQRQQEFSNFQQMLNQQVNRFPPDALQPVIRDMGNSAITNSQMLQILNAAGFRIQPNASQTNRPPSSAIPAEQPKTSTNAPSH
jgi:hypothetical protein